MRPYVKNPLWCVILVATAIGTALGFAGCAQTGGVPLPSVTVTMPQAIADAQNAVLSLGNALKAIQQTAPNAVPADQAQKIQAALLDATSVLTALSGSVTATQAAPVLKQVEGDINAVILAASGIPAIPPPFSVALAATSVVLPIVEGFIDTVLPAPAASAPLDLVAARSRAASLLPLSPPAAEALLAAMARR